MTLSNRFELRGGIPWGEDGVFLFRSRYQPGRSEACVGGRVAGFASLPPTFPVAPVMSKSIICVEVEEFHGLFCGERDQRRGRCAQHATDLGAGASSAVGTARCYFLFLER